MPEIPILLECRNICKSFGQNKVLRDINLQIKKGEAHALLGTNGAGKSTLVKIITGVYSKNSGDILIDGEVANIKSPQVNRPPEVRPKNLTIGGRFSYGKI